MFVFVVFVIIGVKSKGGRLIGMFWRSDFLFFPSLKLIFIVIVLVRLRLIHSNRCSFTKNMIRRAPIGAICRTSNYGSGGTEATAFIQCINVQEPQVHELWCLVLDRISRKVDTTARVEVPAETMREFRRPPSFLLDTESG